MTGLSANQMVHLSPSVPTTAGGMPLHAGHNASACIPVFTAGTGWKAQPMMQWSTAYGIPAALAVSGSWSLFLKHVRTFQCLHYWWVPDSTFIQMLPEQLVFARHSANEWLAGDKKTGGARKLCVQDGQQQLAIQGRPGSRVPSQ